MTLAVLAGTGFVTRPLLGPARAHLRGDGEPVRLPDVEAALGQGVTVALLGGFRTITADFLWLKTNSAWERRDLPATQSLIRVVTAVDSRPLYFWINGARMVAYDMPYWRIEEAGGVDRLPRTVQWLIDAEQARLGLEILERALAFHPGEARLYVEMANIHLRRLNDVPAAAALYRRAAECAGAPFYAARVHGALLEQMGRHREAYAWLRQVHPTLPADQPEAMPEVVLERIRQLEARLGIAEDERYRPPNE